jgi:uncharacterized membrane protein YcjF (UPF0283 family)
MSATIAGAHIASIAAAGVGLLEARLGGAALDGCRWTPGSAWYNPNLVETWFSGLLEC